MTSLKQKWHKWKHIAREHQVPESVFIARIHVLKWDERKAATDPVNESHSSKLFTPEERKIMRENGIPLQTANRRLKSGNYTRVQAISDSIRGKVR